MYKLACMVYINDKTALFIDVASIHVHCSINSTSSSIVNLDNELSGNWNLRTILVKIDEYQRRRGVPALASEIHLACIPVVNLL